MGEMSTKRKSSLTQNRAATRFMLAFKLAESAALVVHRSERRARTRAPGDEEILGRHEKERERDEEEGERALVLLRVYLRALYEISKGNSSLTFEPLRLFDTSRFFFLFLSCPANVFSFSHCPAGERVDAIAPGRCYSSNEWGTQQRDKGPACFPPSAVKTCVDSPAFLRKALKVFSIV